MNTIAAPSTSPLNSRQQALLVSGCAWDALVEALGPEALQCLRCERSFVGVEGAEFDAAVELAEHETTGERCTHYPRCDERGHTTESARLQLRCATCNEVTEFTTD